MKLLRNLYVRGAAMVVAGLALALGLSTAHAAAPLYVDFGDVEKGVYYTPDGSQPKIAFLLMHEDANFLNHIACTELSKRGFAVLCMNGPSDNNEALDTWTDLPLTTAKGMDYLRNDRGFKTVLIFAHSGGGPLMTYYQSVAEEGPAVCSGQDVLSPCGDELKGLTPADGMVTFDAHPGTAINMLRSLNPSLLDETDPSRIDPALDPFSEANGYNPKGNSHFSEEFQKRYFEAQSARMNRLIDKALALRKSMKEQGVPYPDDAPFYIPRASVRLMQLDISIAGETAKPEKFLKNDGSVVTDIVRTVRQPDPKRKKKDARFDGGAFLTVESFIGTRAVRSTNAMTDIDLGSNNNSTGRNLQHISVPLLMLTAGGHYFMDDNEQMYGMAKSQDKDFVVVEGAAHGVVPCKACAKAENADYSNSVKNTFDYIAKWVNERF
ncbi:Alpha/beta hydrolase family protein [Hartmannibacter diazotrophicus]|uniref:Alpha/beta hydrolase family protein n=1 Tax=Hartmannibacter diazotrophicus TaxID=1482074 RepID=A0A2C9D1J2_9HYPH|nr:hypothetical protein [Hartmannibacter diazotrophicus]SON54182.1 Alpha/beta hydrolase family protein [Hartmannibacter diazotrophicus]